MEPTGRNLPLTDSLLREPLVAFLTRSLVRPARRLVAGSSAICSVVSQVASLQPFAFEEEVFVIGRLECR